MAVLCSSLQQSRERGITLWPSKVRTRCYCLSSLKKLHRSWYYTQAPRLPLPCLLWQVARPAATAVQSQWSCTRMRNMNPTILWAWFYVRPETFYIVEIGHADHFEWGDHPGSMSRPLLWTANHLPVNFFRLTHLLASRASRHVHRKDGDAQN